MDKIEKVRHEIDLIDSKIMDLLDERFEKTYQIGELKKLHDTKVLDQNRERLILNKTSKYSHSPEISRIYQAIMNESKQQQRK